MTHPALKIGYQGAPGAFSHRAVKIFAEELNRLDEVVPVSCKTFDEVFSRLASHECSHGVIPLENSSVGSIVANYDLLWKSDVEMVGEIYLPIHHNLIGFSDTDVSKLTEIYSHPVALDQCRAVLKELNHAKAVSYWDTSAAAFFVEETGDRQYAAIASQFAAEETGLQILRSNIEDFKGNRTRFGVITQINGHPPAPPVAPYKISCVVEIAHQPGALANLLRNLAILGVNLTKIESRPIPETPWHYRFFLDIEIPFNEINDAVIAAIEKFSGAHKILGRYKPWQEIQQ
ncbi:MAG TPA: prephenate dehydratase domain-containing protein [Drouetiella sp.]